MLRQLPRIYSTNAEILSKDFRKVPTHQLYTKLGFINHPKQGLVHWMPPGWNMVRKLQTIIHRHMVGAGAEEVNLSLFSSAELWNKTGRWENTELFKLNDGETCLAATCEEEITELVKNQIASYKSVPLLYYQIKEKYRDEKRPRGGLLRGREFLMKDAYSFDIDESSAMETYNSVVKAYHGVFTELKVPYVKAEADTGDIGGSLSHEWLYLHPQGEDTVFVCNSCGTTSNMEKTFSFPHSAQDCKDVSVQYFTTKDGNTLVCAYFPSDRVLQPTLLKEEIPDIDLKNTNSDAILNRFSNPETMLNKKVVRIMDSRLTSRSHFPDFPIPFVNRSFITTLTDIPIVTAEAGEICGSCEDGQLECSRAIEVGHTFYLGDKYTDPLGCTVQVPGPNGVTEERNLMMGCYGIGLSRIIGAIGEICKDENGFRWPAAISPWTATVITNGELAEDVKRKLESMNIDMCVDSRPKVGIGKKVRQSQAMGIPICIIVGNKYPEIEVNVRGVGKEEVRMVHVDEMGEYVGEVLREI
ncbi:Proline--tRNA ligase cytoplasmic [Meyerozyma sp. JA9]|nr:Proline--tRNA ligase cytoplasmic [Meyerozyma sp. JA9]